jgi:hypothetical protein
MHAKILFERGWGDIATRPLGGGVVGVDGSFLPYLLEELIAGSATEVIVPFQRMAGSFLGDHPSPFDKYIRGIDAAPARRRATAFLGPVAEEIGLRADENAFRTVSGERFTRAVIGDKGGELEYAEMTVLDGVETLALGIEHSAAVDLDIENLIAASRRLRAFLLDPYGRETLARLEGILATYEATSMPAIGSVPRAPRRLISDFVELIEDREYAELSEAAVGLGIPLRMKRAGQIMRRLASRIVGRERFRFGFNVTSTAVKLGAKIASLSSADWLPKADDVSGLFSAGYLPPALRLDERFAEAARRWKAGEGWD